MSMSIGYSRPIPDNFTTDALKYIQINIRFIESWLNKPRITLFGVVKTIKNMDENFKKIPTTIPVNNPQYFKDKPQSLLTNTGSKCYIE